MSKPKSLQQIRNIGIMAHIDAGKTTTTERILYYTGKVHRIGEVDDGAATMDWMEQEKERGITITSAAISCQWKKHQINIIDTPGHVDFTVEVERSLRVLDGAVAIFCAVGGVEPQSETVWLQANKYHIPRIAYINKMDRMGADFYNAIQMMIDRLHTNPVVVELPVGASETFDGLIDLVSMKWLKYHVDDLGSTWEEREIPADMMESAEEYRHKLLDAVVEYDDELLEKYLSGDELTEENVIHALRLATLTTDVVPVFCGASARNQGVQQLIDAIVNFLPSPVDVPEIHGENPFTQKMESRSASLDDPFTALIFKVQSDSYVGRITYCRVYSGSIKAGDTALNTRENKKERLQRIIQMSSNKQADVQTASAGDIVAIVGLRHAKTGDTLCDLKHPLLLEELVFPVPVISVAIEPKSKADEEKLVNALNALVDEDPTFTFSTNEETGQMLISGMGELHLEVFVDRLFREFKVKANVGNPQVAYRETITEKVTSTITFERQMASKNQYAKVVILFEPLAGEKIFEFQNNLDSKKIPREFIKPIEDGIHDSLVSGSIAGYPVINIKATLLDADFDETESSELAFKIAATMALQDALKRGSAVLMEPIMALEVITPDEYFGSILSDLAGKRGKIERHSRRGESQVVDAKVPLAETFGYATSLRNMSQGRAVFTLQFHNYKVVTGDIFEKLLRKMGLMV